jgi:hypothetical protein
MNEPKYEPSGEKRDEPADEETPGRWLFGCLWKTLVVFVVIVLLVFGACFLFVSL